MMIPCGPVSRKSAGYRENKTLGVLSARLGVSRVESRGAEC